MPEGGERPARSVIELYGREWELKEGLAWMEAHGWEVVRVLPAGQDTRGYRSHPAADHYYLFVRQTVQ